MPNQNVNKVIYNGSTLIDLTEDTITPGALLRGYTAHDATGTEIEGNLSVATQSTDGLMSSSDKTKLDGIEQGAQVNDVTSVNGKTGSVNITAEDVGALTHSSIKTYTFSPRTDSNGNVNTGWNVTDRIIVLAWASDVICTPYIVTYNGYDSWAVHVTNIDGSIYASQIATINFVYIEGEWFN